MPLISNIMKSYIKLLTLGAVLTGATACTDLDTEFHGYYTEYPNTPEALDGKLQGCYNYFQESLRRDYKELVLLASDEFLPISFGGDYCDGRYYNPYRHLSNPEDANANGVYSAFGNGIVYTNRVILELIGADGTGKEPIIAPLRAIRAFYHFQLMELYGDVPILERNVEEGVAVERRPRAEVAKWIEQELIEAIPDLSEANDITTYAKPNKWMAEALLAKLYLNWGVYTHDITTVDNSTPNEKLNDCVKWCDEIIKSGLFEVGTGYRQKFFPDNAMKVKDFIYATNYNKDNGHDWGRYFQFRQNKGSYKSYWGFELTQSCGGNIKVNPLMVDILNALPGDERAKTIIGGPVFMFDSNYDITDEPFMYNGAQYVLTKDINIPNVTFELDAGKNIQGWSQGNECVKYPINTTYNTDGRRQTNNIPIFRYADILLTKAECILRGATATNGATAAALVNEVRDCCGAPHCSSITLDELLDERGREFFAELWRRNDLIRFGQYEKERPFVKEINPEHWNDKRMRLFPIPKGTMNTNVNWNQNPGY